MARTLDRSAQSIKSAKELIASRRPLSSGDTIFSLKTGVDRMLKPKFIFTDKDGNLCHVRYSDQYNTIFLEEQQSESTFDEVKLARIHIGPNTIIKNPQLVDFLLLHPEFNKKYVLIDPESKAKEELSRIDLFDEVWDAIRSLTLEKLKALYILLNGGGFERLVNIKAPELKLSLRMIASKDPLKVKDALGDSILDTIYLYHISLALGVIKWVPVRNAILWSDSGKEICKVPINKDPGFYLAKLLLQDDYLSIRELLEKEMND